MDLICEPFGKVASEQKKLGVKIELTENGVDFSLFPSLAWK